MNPVIENLKKSGWTVQIRHWRYVGLGNNPPRLVRKAVMREVRDSINALVGHKLVQIQPKGGKTRIDIRRENEHFFSESDCSINDVFNYGLGVNLAVERLKLGVNKELVQENTL